MLCGVYGGQKSNSMSFGLKQMRRSAINSISVELQRNVPKSDWLKILCIMKIYDVCQNQPKISKSSLIRQKMQILCRKNVSIRTEFLSNQAISQRSLKSSNHFVFASNIAWIENFFKISQHFDIFKLVKRLLKDLCDNSKIMSSLAKVQRFCRIG